MSADKTENRLALRFVHQLFIVQVLQKERTASWVEPAPKKPRSSRKTISFWGVRWKKLSSVVGMGGVDCGAFEVLLG